MAARDRHANRVNGVESIERVFFDLFSKVEQELFLPNVGAIVALETGAGLSKGKRS